MKKGKSDMMKWLLEGDVQLRCRDLLRLRYDSLDVKV